MCSSSHCPNYPTRSVAALLPLISDTHAHPTGDVLAELSDSDRQFCLREIIFRHYLYRYEPASDKL